MLAVPTAYNPPMRAIALASVVLISFITVIGAQQPPDPAARQALTAATAADHQEMMQQLGIRTPRRGVYRFCFPDAGRSATKKLAATGARLA